MIITKEEIEAVLAGCDGVTPGPYKCRLNGTSIYVLGKSGTIVCRVGRRSKSEAAHIARLFPEFVRGLAIRALEALSSREAGWQPIETALPCVDLLCAVPLGIVTGKMQWLQIVAQKVPAHAGAWLADGVQLTTKPLFWRLLPNPPDQGSKSP